MLVSWIILFIIFYHLAPNTECAKGTITEKTPITMSHEFWARYYKSSGELIGSQIHSWYVKNKEQEKRICGTVLEPTLDTYINNYEDTKFVKKIVEVKPAEGWSPIISLNIIFLACPFGEKNTMYIHESADANRNLHLRLFVVLKEENGKITFDHEVLLNQPIYKDSAENSSYTSTRYRDKRRENKYKPIGTKYSDHDLSDSDFRRLVAE